MNAPCASRRSEWRRASLLLAMFLLFWFMTALELAIMAAPFQNFRHFASGFVSHPWHVFQLSLVYPIVFLGILTVLYTIGWILLVGRGVNDAVGRNWARLIAASLLIGGLMHTTRIASVPVVFGPLMSQPEGWLTSRLAALMCYVVAIGVAVLLVSLAVLVSMKDRVVPAGVCEACGYEVGALVKCPECGTDRARRSG